MKKQINLICFWCEKVTSQTATVDVDNPEELESAYVVDYEPCPACRQKWDDGAAVIIEVEKDPVLGFNLPILKDKDIPYYPTGKYVVVTKEWITTNIKDPYKEHILEDRTMFIGPEVFQNLFSGLENLVGKDINNEPTAEEA